MLDFSGVMIIVKGGKFFRIISITTGKRGKVTIESEKEEVRFYEGLGWLTSDELFKLRQKHPRTAP